MKINVLNFVKILNICFFLYLIYEFVGILDKGFDHADESFHILSSIHPNKVNFFFSYFHFFTSIIYKVSFENILNSRILIFIILLLSSNYFVLSLFKKFFDKDVNEKYYPYMVMLATSPIIFYYFLNTFSPSYNILNLIFILNLIAIMINYFQNKNFSYYSVFGISTFFFLILINKVTSGFLIFLLISLFFFNSKSCKKNFSVFFIICFFYLSLLFLNKNIFYIFNLFLSIIANENDKFGFLNNHNLIALLEENLKYLIKVLVTYKYYFVYLFFSALTIFRKKNYNSYLVLFIFGKNIYHDSFVVWLDVIYLIIYNLICVYRMQNVSLMKQNLIILCLMFFLSFTYYFGTNIEISRFLLQSGIFTYTGVIFIFFLNYNIKFKEYLINFLVLAVLMNTYDFSRFVDKYEFFTNRPIKENNKSFDSYYNNKLFLNIKIRSELVEFNKSFEKILQENNWNKNVDVLIDATLKHPGILLVANSRFLESPWYFHRSEKLISSLKNTNLQKAPWFVVSPSQNNNKKIIMDHFNKNKFILIGQLKHPYTKKDINLYKPANHN